MKSPHSAINNARKIKVKDRKIQYLKTGEQNFPAIEKLLLQDENTFATKGNTKTFRCVQ